MCRDLDAVRAAVAARVDIQSSACLRHSQHCPHISTCLKQKNRQEVAAAEVVVAAYDAMFTGFAGDMTAFALVVIDEGFWQRSWQDAPGLSIEGLPGLGIGAVGTGRKRDKMGAAQADVIAMREKLARALIANGPGPLRREPLDAEGITLADCRDAMGREWQAMPDLRLKPGQPAPERRIALVRALDVAGRRRAIDLWSEVEALLADGGKGSGRIQIDGPDGRTGLRPIRLFERKSIAEDIARRPILHLDATLRPELVEPFLSDLQIEIIDARAPHQHVRLIAGSFGKANLCDEPHIPTEERARRSNRLQDCVDHVRWHALRHRGRRCLVITYKDCEDAFAAVPGVETAHFNAIAGLDAYGDVAALFVIGRPLPQAAQLAAPVGALYGTAVAGNYHKVSAGIWLPGGKQTAITVRRHADARAEVLRAAICEDEVLQAVGRGRGINRRVDDPLEVHVLADVVLPLEHSLVQAWSAIVPDIVQRMLLAGIAVDSPADAARLHPGLFENEEQAKKAFQRGLFGGHSPIRDIYREMSLKSAGYRRLGRGRGWQRAWWIEGTEAEARVWLEAAVGPLAKWDPL